MFHTTVEKTSALAVLQGGAKSVLRQWPLIGAVCVSIAFAWAVITVSNRPFLPQPAKGHYWKLAFSDEFNGDRLDPTRWVTCYDWYDPVYQGCTNSGNHELQWYGANQVALTNGNAVLTAKQQPAKGWSGSSERTYPYSSGMISTGRGQAGHSPRWSTLYGYYEARMKVSSGRGLWPAFWLLPIDGSWPPEIDIMEILGHEPNTVRMTYHWQSATGHPAYDSHAFAGSDFTRDWHVYSLEWLPGSIRWYIDGTLRKEVVNENVPDKPMELIINLAVGGTLPGSPDASTAFPSRVHIDYVRAYQLTPQ